MPVSLLIAWLMKMNGLRLEQFHLFRWFNWVAGALFFKLFTCQPSLHGQTPQVAKFQDPPLPGQRPKLRVAVKFVSQEAGSSTRDDEKVIHRWGGSLAQETSHHCRGQEG